MFHRTRAQSRYKKQLYQRENNFWLQLLGQCAIYIVLYSTTDSTSLLALCHYLCIHYYKNITDGAK